MNYPVSTYDSYGAQQLPKESTIEIQEKTSTEVTDTDYFGNIIQANDRVFELTFELYELNEELHSLSTYKITETATQSTIAELIDELGAESLKYIEHIGLGKEIYGGLK